MDFDTIRYEIADGLCRVTLHRPDRMNAMTNQMVREAYDALDTSRGRSEHPRAGAHRCRHGLLSWRRPQALHHWRTGRDPDRARVRGDDAAARDPGRHGRRDQRSVRGCGPGVGAGMRRAGDDRVGEVEHGLSRRGRRRRHGHPVVAPTHRRSRAGTGPVVLPAADRSRRGGTPRDRGSGVRRRDLPRRRRGAPRRRCSRSRRPHSSASSRTTSPRSA